MEVLIFDTETTPDRALAKDGELVGARGEAIFPKTPLHEVRAIAYALFVWENGVPVFKRAQAAGRAESSERELLSGFWSYVEKTKPQLVSWNGRSFDIPVLISRAMRNRVSARGHWHEQSKFERYRYKYAESQHLDLCESITDFGKDKFSLDLAARMVGAPGKLDTQGSQVEEMIREGRIEDVRVYCVVDCLNLAAVYLRWCSIQGLITFEQEDAAKESICSWIKTQPESMAELKRFGSLWAGSTPATTQAEFSEMRASA